MEIRRMISLRNLFRFLNRKTKLLLFLTITLLVAVPYNGLGRELSNNAEIYLITCDPGTDLYSAFGHSAIWVIDKESRVDFVYNYGVFDFDTPNFYSKFVRGQLLYKVTRSSFSRFVRAYFYEKRSVYKQKLLISHDEKQNLFDALETNYLPENQYYLYDFLYNNCSTKIIDKIEECSDDPGRFVHLYEKTDTSFRQNLDKYLYRSPWVDFGIDLALGLPADKLMTVREGMFLPDNLMNSINSKTQPITLPAELVYKGNDLETGSGYLSPFNLILVISVVFFIITLVWKKKRLSVIVDVILFGITGLLGLFLLFLWFGTDHQSMKINLNLLWAMPFNLIYLFRSLFSKKKFYRIYWLAYSIVLVFLLMSWSFFPQEFHNALIPLIVLLAVRAFANRSNY